MKLPNISSKIVCLLAAAVLFSSGCQSMTSFGNKSIPTEPLAKSAGQYQVVMMPTMGKPQTFTGNVTPSLTVQTALEESGALKKFRSMKIDIYRLVDDSGKTLKMACELQPGKRIVKFEQDYQILPGDRIVVTAESSGIESLLKR